MIPHLQKLSVESAAHTFWQKMVCLLKSIRVRLTLWYVATTAAILALFGGLLYSTIVKTQPPAVSSDLPRIGQQIFLLELAILLFIAVSGYWLASKAMRPVRLITRTAQEIGKTNLNRRFQLNGSDELSELAATFNEMLNRLEAVLNRQRQFTADASHELRTPLSMLTLATNRALAQKGKPESYEQALALLAAYQLEFSHIQAETNHMSRLVNDLLLLARADIEQTTLTPTEVDMSDVALEVVERLAPLAQQRGIELVFGELPELCVRGDRLLLTLMVTNVIDNALKYTAGVGDRVQIGADVVRREKHNWGRIWIEDNGPGIADEHQIHLFERFYRVDVARHREEDETTGGSGLGLAIVQWIAQLHQGEVHLGSTVGCGSCFELWLPLLRDGNAYEDAI